MQNRLYFNCSHSLSVWYSIPIMVFKRYKNKPAILDHIKLISSKICFDTNHHHSFLQAPYFYLMICKNRESKNNDSCYDYRTKYVTNISYYYLFSILFVENTLTVTLHSSIGQTCIELFWRHFVSATLLLRFKHFKVLCSLSLHLSQITCSNQVTFEIYVYSKEI